MLTLRQLLENLSQLVPDGDQKLVHAALRLGANVALERCIGQLQKYSSGRTELEAVLAELNSEPTTRGDE